MKKLFSFPIILAFSFKMEGINALRLSQAQANPLPFKTFQFYHRKIICIIDLKNLGNIQNP